MKEGNPDLTTIVPCIHPKKRVKIKVMKIFNNIFLKKEQKLSFTFWDYFKNYKGFIKMGYYYLRHKLYNHYFNYLEARIFKTRIK